MKNPEAVHDGRVLREDYQPPAWLVESVELEFDLRAPRGEDGGHSVDVLCRQRLRSRDGRSGPLRLDGRELELRRLRIDGDEPTAGSWRLTPDALEFDDFPAAATLETVARLNPFANASLEGLYGSEGLLCTQCEAHGFSRITWFMDRPDVLSTYRVEILADATRYPVLLSNGNRLALEQEGDSLRAVWEDPHPKPCYLFALVAGDLACVRDSHRTPSGRDVAIEFWCDYGLEDQLAHAVDSLKNAMAFDESVYGREYDLDLYMVVVARAFNMGAMENKGLNIFNPKCVLAHPRTATDEDHVVVEAVVAHEYLHNWTGNRITCRDWFQLALKEGLTVFREQVFSAAHAGGSAQRINEVRLLKSRQFVEDAGPLSHPVRPVSYVDMNNFYTLTVYEKGAELVRVLAALVGEAGFTAGLQRYFERHDGDAATIEDFLDCFADPQGAPVRESMLRWYDQPGTPRVQWAGAATDARHYRLELTQLAPANWAGPADFAPVPIPLRVALLDDEGLVPLADGGSEAALTLAESRGDYTLEAARPFVGEPAAVAGGAFPAPVVHLQPQQATALRLAARAAPDPVSRWEAQQKRYLAAIEGALAGQPLPDFADLREGCGADADPAVLAEMLTPSAPAALLAQAEAGDPLAIVAAHEAVEDALAHSLWQQPALLEPWLAAAERPWRFNADDVGRRRLGLRLLQLGLRAGVAGLDTRAEGWLAEGDNLSLRFGALAALAEVEHPRLQDALEAFEARHARDELVLDRAWALRARHAGAAGLEALLARPGFDRRSPNRVRAVLDTLARANLRAFYAEDGQAQALWARELVAIDALNPQLAARLVGAAETMDRLAEPWQGRLRATLAELRSRARSAAVHEQLRRLLGESGAGGGAAG